MKMIPEPGLIEQLQGIGPFAHLSAEEIAGLLAAGHAGSAKPGEVLIAQGGTDRDYLVLLEGELEVSRTWVESGEREEVRLGYITPGQGVGEISLLGSPPRGASVRAIRPSRFVRLDSDRMDELLAWSQQFAHNLEADAELRIRMNAVRQAKSLRALPLPVFQTLFERMQTLVVESGEVIVSQGEKGDRYYLIDEGQAEVWRTDPITNATARVAVLGPSDVFGEEALLLDGFRNATVIMATPGELLALDKTDFDELVRVDPVAEIGAAEARQMVGAGAAQWLDCRYAIEYEDSHIPGARLAPLDRIREECSALDRGRSYVVYCRSGRRSVCAAYLLRERGIHALSLRGGISDWPYALEGARA
jgi:CRP-like cAMP-binding protein